MGRMCEAKFVASFSAAPSSVISVSILHDV
jgi:hypothetical protein